MRYRWSTDYGSNMLFKYTPCSKYLYLESTFTMASSIGTLTAGSEGRKFEADHDHREQHIFVKQAAKMVGQRGQNFYTKF